MGKKSKNRVHAKINSGYSNAISGSFFIIIYFILIENKLNVYKLENSKKSFQYITTFFKCNF